MTKTQLQNIVNKMAKEFGVPPIKLVFTDKRGPGLACYTTFRYRVGGKIEPKNYPKNITIYTWSKIKDSPGQVAYEVGHELAHHIQNIKKNSLVHNNTFYDLEEKVAMMLSKLLR
jgi:hypothetical protein